jgi:O-antigen ligase
MTKTRFAGSRVNPAEQAGISNSTSIPNRRSTASYKSSPPKADRLTKAGYLLVILAMIFEFGRPQDIFSPLKVIPIPTLLDVSLFLAVMMSGKLSLANLQTKLWIPFLGMMALWVPFATNNYYALMTLKDMTLYAFFYLGIITFVDTVERMNKVMLTWLSVHTVLAINGILHSGQGIGGWLGDENDFAMEMNVAVPFAFFMHQGAKTVRGKTIYGILVGLFVLTTVSTMSRGGFLGLTVTGLFCWYYSSGKLKSIALIMCVVALVSIFAPEEYGDRLRSITDQKTTEEGTAGERMFTWGIGWEMFLANPVFGVGQGNFPWTIGDYMGGRTWQTRSLAGRAAHSLYFTLLPELGIAGLLIFAIMVYRSYRDVKICSSKVRTALSKTRDKHGAAYEELPPIPGFAAAVLGAMIGYLMTSVFISTLYYPTFWILVALIVALRNTTDNIFAQNSPAPDNVVASQIWPKPVGTKRSLRTSRLTS